MMQLVHIRAAAGAMGAGLPQDIGGQPWVSSRASFSQA